MERRFIEEFATINEHFTKVFSELFGGGKAQPHTGGRIRRTGVRHRDRGTAAGQEAAKAVTALRRGAGADRHRHTLCHISGTSPRPFCVLDEIETALDDHNVEQFAQFLRDFSHQTQFVIITHRKGTMNSSHVLYGIAMEEKGVSKLVSVSLEDIPQAV